MKTVNKGERMLDVWSDYEVNHKERAREILSKLECGGEE